MLTRNLPGEWKENSGQREGLSEFIDAVGKLRIGYTTQTNFWLEKEHSYLHFHCRIGLVGADICEILIILKRADNRIRRSQECFQSQNHK